MMANYRLLDKDVTTNGCFLCEVGHRRDGQDHIVSQSKGMIPTTPCRAVVTYPLGDATESNKLPWVVRVNGHLVASKNRVAKIMFPGT